MQAILCTSSKGGVGKSEIARLTAEQLNRDEFDVAMMDADIDSSNLSSRMGLDDTVTHTDDDLIKPLKTDNGIKVYSMESAFEDSSFSQGGEFMRTVIRDMIHGTQWGDPDYLVVDCPPGTKDIYNELVNQLRHCLLGSVVIGQSDSYDDVGRMIKVSDYNYVPIIGLIENMSGIYSEGEMVVSPRSGNTVAPFGRGNIKQLADGTDARFLGSIPLCDDKSDIEEAATNTIKALGNAIHDAEPAQMPDINEGDQGFIRNVLKAFKATIQTANEELDVAGIQEEYGNPDNPKNIELELTDVKSIWPIPNSIHLRAEGRLKVVRNPDTVFGGMKISSQELKYALEGERKMMNSTRALYIDDPLDTRPYGLTDAVKMGNAEVWGEDITNYLSLLDKIFNKVIDKSVIQQAMSDV